MTNCTKCFYAQWERTEKGRLHPSGDGKCSYQCVDLPPLPAAMYWIGGVPSPSGGYINRRKTWRSECPYYTVEQKP